MQTAWFFRDRSTGRIYLDCVAETHDALCELAAKKYGRTPQQWANHPDSEAVCVQLELRKNALVAKQDF